MQFYGFGSALFGKPSESKGKAGSVPYRIRTFEVKSRNRIRIKGNTERWRLTTEGLSANVQIRITSMRRGIRISFQVNQIRIRIRNPVGMDPVCTVPYRTFMTKKSVSKHFLESTRVTIFMPANQYETSTIPGNFLGLL